ncbi:MAG TPA: shikimate kinase [Mycobacteriales bacterium]|nr:shikimate kinase [Mycobacteriales bacterium]
MSRWPVLLVGMMGSGKTTVGRIVAARLGVSYLDNDVQVRQATGHTVPQIAETAGSVGVRAAEADYLRSVLDHAEPVVAGVPAGVVVDPALRALLRTGGFTVWLRARPSTLAARVGTGAGRPWLDDDPERVLAALDTQRAGWYGEVAEVVVDVDDLTADQAADRIVAAHQGA